MPEILWVRNLDRDHQGWWFHSTMTRVLVGWYEGLERPVMAQLRVLCQVLVVACWLSVFLFWHITFVAAGMSNKPSSFHVWCLNG